ncbi:MAG: M67 family metallopeptidase [Candidatus Bathyarchaeota archaeon]|nr:M67 family metallopeptidase [Candidatus Bathyarchaeum sp.]
MNQEAEKVQPIEACALIFGKLHQDQAVVKKIDFAKNKLESPIKFQIDPEKVAAAFTEAMKEDLEFIGVFHSHPAPAAPSSTDLEGMRLWGNTLWLILSLTDSELAAYQLLDNSVEEATLQID